MFNLRNFLLSSSLLFSIFSSPVFSNPKVLKVGAIPDQNQDVLDKRFNLFSKELSKQLNVKVKYIPVINYVAAVTGFRTKDLDLVWFGGLSGVQARLQTPNSIVIAQRDIDKEFKSVFIVNKNLKLTSISNIKGLKKLKNLRFTFGSENSTSGRLMPEYFLNQAGIEIKHFRGKKAGFSGSHDATIALVNSGAFDAGALNKKTVGFYPSKKSSTSLRWQTINNFHKRLSITDTDRDKKNINVDIKKTVLEIQKLISSEEIIGN